MANRCHSARSYPLLIDAIVFVCIGSLAWLRFHSISPAVLSPCCNRSDWRRPAYNYIVSRESIVLLGWPIPTWLELWQWWELSEYCRWWKTRSLVPLSPTSSPPHDVHICQLGLAIITNIHSPTSMCIAFDIISILGQPPAIFDGSLSSPIDHVELIILHNLRHTTQLGQLRISRCPTPTNIDICINSHQNVIIRLACYWFHNCYQNFANVVWGTWYVCHIFAATSSLSVWVSRIWRPNLVMNWKKGVTLLPWPR